MARNRTIYQTEAIYVSDNIDSITKSEHKNISRVQSANYGFSINKERVNQYGQLGEIDSIVVEAPNVDFEMSYYLTNGDNEYFLNLDTGYGGFLKNQIVSSGQNIYVANIPEGKDVQDQNWDNFSVISIGNAFVTDYTVDFGVGSLPKVNVGFSALNISSQTNLTKTSGHFIGIENAGVNPLNGVKSTQQIEVLAEINQSGQSAIRPSDTSITITPTKTLGDNDSISILSTLDGGAHIQTASLNVNLDRTSLQRLGSNLAYAKVVEPPTTATVSISAIVNEVKSSSLSDILDHSNEYTIEIESVDPDGYQLCKYSLVGAKLDSESFGSAIGSNKVVDLTFTTQLGGIGQTNYNMFFEKYGFLDFFPSAAAAYSLRNLTADFDQKVVRVRRESDNSERDFTEYDIKNGTMVDWVNKQVIRPLDIRELDDENGNRPDTNDFIDKPAAAYSLRSLGENQADITINDSSDERNGETGKFVVQTRRNVDEATKSFTADEVADGTMEKWVEGWELYTPSTKTLRNEPYWDLIPTDNQNFQIISNNADSDSASWRQVRLVNPQDLRVGKNLVTFDVTVNSGTLSTGHTTSSLSLYGRDGSHDANTSDVKFLSEGFNSYILETVDNAFGYPTDIFFSSGPNSKFDVTISNLKVYKSTVNELPLDQATGAAAAYSLRNLSASGTDVTINDSSDERDGETGKYVVQVRRSSDDAVKSFTAAEVADGTLTDWVTEEIVHYESDFSENTDGWNVTAGSTSVSDGAIVLVPNTSSTTHFASRYSSLPVGKKLRVTFDVKIPSGQSIVTGFRITEVSGTLIKSLNSQTQGEFVSYSEEITPVNTGMMRFFAATNTGGGVTFSGDDSEKLIIKNIVVTVIDDDGHVKTWYDQSDNANDATQTDPAKQPKIVENGNLLKNELGNPSVKTTGSGDHLLRTITDSSKYLSQNPELTIFSFSDKSGNARQPISLYSSISGGARYFTIEEGGAETKWIPRNTISNQSVSATISGNVRLSVGVTTSNTDYKVAVNGGSFVAGTGDYGNTLQPAQRLDQILIGKFRTSQSDSFNGFITELIIYNTDQSTKRRAIEENIANHYNITLADSSRDGTVRTWYDQSGNPNHATQTDPAKQPKIVDGGTYLEEVDFLDGTDTFLETTNSDLCNVSELSVFTVLKPHLAESQCIAFSCGSTVGNSSSYGGWKLNLNGYIDSAQLQTQAVGNSAITSVGASVTADDTLLSYIATFPNVSTFANGQAGTTTTSAVSPNNPNTTIRRFRIGCQYTFQAAGFYTKPIKEIIIYNSDQSDNRTAIEANIGEHYGIVGIPAYENKVNGFVETWYDQSGSGNDMKQPTSSKQPKIVGEVTPGQPHALLENGLKFDGGQQLINTGGIGGGSDIALYLVGNRDNDLITRNTFVGTNTDFALGSSDQLMLRVNSSNSFTLNITPPTAGEQVLYAALVSDRLPTLKQNNTSRTRSSAFDTDITNTFSIIGDNGTTPHPTYALVGSIAEIIYYTSDQSSNSPSIEANIANHYGITLS